MKISFLTSQNSIKSRRLLLFFSGWGCDDAVARCVKRADFDIAVACEYAAVEPVASDMERIASYGEIIVLAWSYGVAVGARFLAAHPELPVSLRLAVNGTHTPVDSNTGISPEIYHGTLAGLSEVTLRKFRLRMCGSADSFKRYCAEQLPNRDIESLRSEQEYLGSISAADVDGTIWDMVYVSDTDNIIPTAAQQRAWATHPGVNIIAGSHLPDFTTIIERNVVDKQYLSSRFQRSRATYDGQANIQEYVATHLAALLSQYVSRDAHTLEVGCGSGMLTRHLEQMVDTNRLTLWDIAPIPEELSGRHCQCDAEAAIRAIEPRNFDLIVSASAIQWFDSPSRFVGECARTLTDGGVLAIATYGPATFAALRPFTTGFAPRYYDESWWRKRLESDFDIVELSSEVRTLNFDSSMDLARHMSQTGVNASKPSAPALRKLINSGLCKLDYQPIYIVAIAKSK